MASGPLGSLIVFACAFSWWLVPISGYPLGSGPFLAAPVVLSLTEGRARLGSRVSMAPWSEQECLTFGSTQSLGPAVRSPAAPHLTTSHEARATAAPQDPQMSLNPWSGRFTASFATRKSRVQIPSAPQNLHFRLDLSRRTFGAPALHSASRWNADQDSGESVVNMSNEPRA